MSDLLIRNIEPRLKKRLEDQARRDGKSLSEEAKALLNEALARREPSKPLGTALVEHFRGVNADLDCEIRDLPRSPPDFE